jgi:type IV secretory pathway TrbL component
VASVNSHPQSFVRYQHGDEEGPPAAVAAAAAATQVRKATGSIAQLHSRRSMRLRRGQEIVRRSFIFDAWL